MITLGLFENNIDDHLGTSYFPLKKKNDRTIEMKVTRLDTQWGATANLTKLNEGKPLQNNRTQASSQDSEKETSGYGSKATHPRP
ncbi:hypothetical protein IFM47457_06413 [Aspergillus lentulus]|nr:hypothetical protein IFM47457_06413 [Aspergillus lentulus]